jgi:DNA-binding transcriptional regulator YdaS (Cro superfamily)
MVSMHPQGEKITLANAKPFIAGAIVLAIGLLALDDQRLGGWLQAAGPQSAEGCEKIVQSNSQLSREQLAQLLVVPERDPKENVRKIVAEPYCSLPQLQVRSGVVSEREAYPMAWDPTVQLVILYENDEYAGYRFRFQ